MVLEVNELIKTMATDMSIYPYSGETPSSFIYRVVYSGLGQWCLKSACAPDGITKRAQTVLLNELTDRYTELFPELFDMLIQEDQLPISVFIRRIYEETGYLITNSLNRNSLASYGRGLQINSRCLFFGLSNRTNIDGLGVFSDDARFSVTWREILIRDELDCEDFISSKFDILNFDKRDISTEELQFFNPISKTTPSSSWSNIMPTEKTIARKLSTGSYYRVMQYNGELLYCDEIPNRTTDELTSFEYRRLYFALKKYYEYPVQVWIKKLDDKYSKLTLGGHLPNREYYFILLCSWPDQLYSNKRAFIIKNENLAFIKCIFENLGIEMVGG